MAGRNFVSDEMASRIQQSVSYTENIGAQNRPIKRRIVRQRGGAAGSNFALCTITSEISSSKFAVDVKIGNPNEATSGSLPKGHLYLNYATTNAVAVGAQLMAIFYPSTAEGVEYDCFPIETLYNLVAPPEEEEE